MAPATIGAFVNYREYRSSVLPQEVRVKWRFFELTIGWFVSFSKLTAEQRTLLDRALRWDTLGLRIEC